MLAVAVAVVVVVVVVTPPVVVVEVEVEVAIVAPTDIGEEELSSDVFGVLLVMICSAELTYNFAEPFSRIKEMICGVVIRKVGFTVVKTESVPETKVTLGPKNGSDAPALSPTDIDTL